MFSPDITDIANLVTLGDSFDDPKSVLNVSANSDKVTLTETNDHPSLEKPSSGATVLDDRYKGNFVSSNIINLPKRHLSKDENSLLSKVLNLSQLLNTLTKLLLKKHGRKLRLMWYCCNEEREIIFNRFKKKSKFNPKRKDAFIEISLSRLEE